MPAVVTFSEISLLEFGLTVLISAIHIPSCLPMIRPELPKITSFTASESFTTVITKSEFSATCLGDSPTIAPFFLRFSVFELEEERNKKLRYDLLERELNRYRAISAATNLKTIQSEKISKDKTLNSLNSEIKHLEEERASLRKDAAEIRKQKTEFMDEVNAYNKSKSEIETKLSYERRKFDESDSLIQKRQILPWLEKVIELSVI